MGLFCLIHGTTQSPAAWYPLVGELQKRGHSALCVDLPVDQPQAGAALYAQAIAATLGKREPAVVVAHSGSGIFLPLVPQYAAVARLVFLAAVIPQPGRSLLQQYRAAPEMFYPDWPGKDPTKDPEQAKHFLFHDCPPELLPWALGTLRLMNPQQAFVEPCPLDTWPSTPSSYILCRDDRTLNPGWWRAIVPQRLGSAAIELPGGHCPYVSRPAELAEVLAGLLLDEPEL